MNEHRGVKNLRQNDGYNYSVFVGKIATIRTGIEIEGNSVSERERESDWEKNRLAE